MNLSPRQIVAELDKYIIGQDEAKRSVAIALRNRYRRSKLTPEQMEEITPKNIIMKGPTGVGKTEIARRLAKLVKAPFLKVEATKYTEVGYVGRDVESMIRDLAECAIRLVKEEKTAEVENKTRAIAEAKIVNILAEQRKSERGETPLELFKQNILESLKKGYFDGEMIEVQVNDVPKSIEIGNGGAIDLGSVFSGLGMPHKKKTRAVTVAEAKNLIMAEEAEKMIDPDAVNAEAIKRAENEGIIFIDEIDKIASGKGQHGGADVSREGVQRDILPIVEGCTVMTKYGPIKTDFILFIAAGAFHVSKVEDLIPELQGRFPINVELHSLTKQDFIKILTQPKNSITSQYANLLRVDDVELTFTDDAIEKIAEISVEINETSEDIGARRLHTVMESLLEDVSFNACGGEFAPIPVVINKKYVEEHLENIYRDRDLKKYVL